MFWTAVTTALLLVSAVVALKYVVLPNVESYQDDIISRVAASSGMDVSAFAIRGSWSGFRPFVELENVVFRETADSTVPDRLAGAEALRLPRMTVSLSWWSLLMNQIRFVDVSLIGPELALSRRKDGLIYFAGRAINAPQEEQDSGRLVELLLEQPGVEIQRATLTWTDELSPGKTLRFTNVGVRIENGLNGHVIGMTATPPASLAHLLELRGNMKFQKDAGKWSAVGGLYVAVNDVSFAELRAHLPVPGALRAGLGNVRAWIDIDSTAAPPTPTSAGYAMAAFSPVRAITADINLIDTRAQLSPEVSPLNIARLAGRIVYKAQEGGFTVGSKALELRTREGVTLPPADFSLTLQQPLGPDSARGEITGSGIDLKVMAALLEYFPVPAEMRAVAARFSPRGLVQQSRFQWTGYLDNISTFRISGAVTDFALNADGHLPGVSGFTGSVDGDEKGGKFNVAAKNLQLDLPKLMRAPLKFDSLVSDGAWKITADAVEVELARVDFANADLAGDFSGRYSRFRADGPKAKEEKGPGTLDIKGRLSRAAATTIGKYLPNAASQTREYIEWAVRDGQIVSADFALKGEVFEFPFRQRKGGNLRLVAQVKDIDFRYAEGWPMAENVSGELVFENTGFTGKFESGQIFNAKLKSTTIAVDDFSAAPYTLSIRGEAAARGEDVTRFLRESPLISGVGAFTKSVSIEGPGKLELAMKIPLNAPASSTATTKISGSYTMQGGQAKPVFGPQITGLNGTINFTESDVKSSGINGTAFGNPLTVAIGSAADGVVTEFAGRADVGQLGEMLPFAMPQQIKGSTDIAGRISARSAGADITIESSLLGVLSSLPAPLAKRSDEARKLRVVFKDVGQAVEKISVTLAGNAAVAKASAPTPAPGVGGTSVAGPADSAETRIDARFQRRFDARGDASLRGGIASVGVALGDTPTPDGLWFAGTMALLDFDSWRDAFGKFYAPVAAGTAASPVPVDGSKGIEIAGFDFTLGGLVAYGRPFDAMTFKGRHAGEDWRLTVDSDDAVGDLTWRAGAFNDRGAVRARLKKLVLADEVPQPKGLVAAPVAGSGSREVDFPALDIIAEKFTLKDRELGRLELRATPMGDNWRIDQVVISTGHAKLEMDGLWQRFGDPQSPPVPGGKSRTTMNVKVESSNLNALFSQFGFGDQLRRGTGKLEGKLSWPGHTYQFQTAALSGEFAVEARNGQFAKIPVGAGKLLALISLQSIPRRFTFDFRDVFSEGFAFERINGNIKINNGIMSTDNFQIVGTAANVKMSGEVSLPSEQTNLRLVVVPSLGEGVAIGAGVVLGPVGGLGVLAIQKLLQGALSYEYAVTGAWDNPQVDRIKKNAPPSPLPPTPSGAVPDVPASPAIPEPPAKTSP